MPETMNLLFHYSNDVMIIAIYVPGPKHGSMDLYCLDRSFSAASLDSACSRALHNSFTAVGPSSLLGYRSLGLLNLGRILRRMATWRPHPLGVPAREFENTLDEKVDFLTTKAIS